MTELLCVGNPIVDVFIEIEESLAIRYGITEPAQHISRDQAEALSSEPLVDFSGAVKRAGGCAANTAKIAATLGMKTSFAGCIGNDAFASIFEKEMAEAGVSSLISRGNEKTGVCFVCDVGGLPRLAACPGAALELRESHISDELVSGAEVVVIDGYLMDRRPLVQSVLLSASRRGIPAVLDAASVFQVKSKAEDILTYSRSFPLIVFMNADEAIAFLNTVRKSRDEEIPKSEKEKESVILRDVCPMLRIITEGEIFPIFVVKLGSRGALVVAGGNVYREETFSIIARDTTGAGDAFCAAFIAAWIRGKSLSDCASLGNKVAREFLKARGTRIKGGKLKSFVKTLKK